MPPDRGGVGRYVDGLVAALPGAGVETAVVCQARDAALFRRTAPEVRVLPAPDATRRRPVRLAWEQAALPHLAARVRADVVHSPHYTMPLRPGPPVVVTLHDATFFSSPEVHSPIKGRFFRAATRTALQRAARCVVPSDATRAELERLVGADPARLDVALHGVDLDTFRLPTDVEIERVAERLGVGPDYVAFLGTLEPRKNVPALVRAWVRACAGRSSPPALVLAGGSGWDDQVDTAAAAVPSGLRLVRPGYLRLEDLPGYLGGALVVAYPSLGEGFGLPVLEAMACGASVLTTRRLALPEVGGDAVAYSEPDEASLAAALGRLLDDAQERRRLAEAARRRAESFTWAACARVHAASYASALAA